MTINYLPLFFDWPEATSSLTAAEKGRLVDALVKYARGDADCAAPLRGRVRAAFDIFACQIERAEKKRAEQAQQDRENGKKGGRPKKAAPAPENGLTSEEEKEDAEKTPTENQKPGVFQKNPYNNNKENDNNNNNDNEKENDNFGVAAFEAATPGDKVTGETGVTGVTGVTGETETDPPSGIEAFALDHLDNMTCEDIAELHACVAEYGEPLVRYTIAQDYVRRRWRVAANQLIIWRMSHLKTPEEVEALLRSSRARYGQAAGGGVTETDGEHPSAALRAPPPRRGAKEGGDGRGTPLSRAARAGPPRRGLRTGETRRGTPLSRAARAAPLEGG